MEKLDKLSEAGGGAGAFGEDAIGDGLREAAANGGVLNVRIVMRAGEEAEFEQNCGALIVAQDEEAGFFDAAVFRGIDAQELALDVGSESLGFGGKVIGFDAMGFFAPCPVVMDADEDGVAFAVAQIGAFLKGDEFVGGASEDDAQASGFEQWLCLERGVEGEVFFVKAGERAGAAVVSAMAWVEDDGFEEACPGAIILDCATGKEEEGRKECG